MVNKVKHVEVTRVFRAIGWLPNGVPRFAKVEFERSPTLVESLLVCREKHGAELFSSTAEPVECDVTIKYAVTIPVSDTGMHDEEQRYREIMGLNYEAEERKRLLAEDHIQRDDEPEEEE